MEKYKLDKEKKEKEANSATMLESVFTNNPELAKQLGMDPNDPQSISAGAKAGAKNPETFGLISVVQQMGQRQAQANRESELFQMQKQISEMDLTKRKEQDEQEKIRISAEEILPYMRGGEIDPEAAKEIDPRIINVAKKLYNTEQLEKQKRSKESLEDYAKINKIISETNKINADIAEANGPMAAIKNIQANRELMRKQEISIAGMGTYTLGQLQDLENGANKGDKESKKSWDRIKNRLSSNGTYKQYSQQYGNLAAQEQFYSTQQKVFVDDSTSGYTPEKQDQSIINDVVNINTMTGTQADQAIKKEIARYESALAEVNRKVNSPKATIQEQQQARKEAERYNRAINELKNSKYFIKPIQPSTQYNDDYNFGLGGM